MGNIDFRVIFVIENSIQIQTLGLEGNINQVTNSYLGQ